MHNGVMDDLVRQAMRKWPSVPAAFGWLGLDARGRWFLRDDNVQSAGPFPQCKGDLLVHDKLLSFIGRNYAADDQGRWYFQNGPQRVYVELESTPWVWRVQPDGTLHTHTGDIVQAQQCLSDAEGRVYFSSTVGIGLVHTSDMLSVADAIERGDWKPNFVDARQLPEQFVFVRSPLATANT